VKDAVITAWWARRILATARCRSGQFQLMSRLIVGLATTLLVSAGLGCVALGPVAGIAHAGDFHWCPGDPPPQGANGHGGPRYGGTLLWPSPVSVVSVPARHHPCTEHADHPEQG
jgi:hypothetical protein